MSTFRGSSAYNQLLIAHLISKRIFMKYLPPVKNAQKLPKFGFSNISSMAISILMSKIIFINIYQIGTKIKNAQDLLKFGTFDISNIAILIFMSKIIFGPTV